MKLPITTDGWRPPGRATQPTEPEGDRAGRRTVAVFGGGIAGLTAAHELVKRGFDVSLFEQGETFGGKATSYTNDDEREGEHGFRFFPGFYRNVIETMAEIPMEPEGASPRPAPRQPGRFDRVVNELGRLTPALAVLGAVGILALLGGPFRWGFAALAIGVWYVAGRLAGAAQPAPATGVGTSVREALDELKQANFTAAPRPGATLTRSGSVVLGLAMALRLGAVPGVLGALLLLQSWARVVAILGFVGLWFVGGLVVRAVRSVVGGEGPDDQRLVVPLPSVRGPIATNYARPPLVQARWVLTVELAVLAAIGAAGGVRWLWMVPATLALIVLASPGTARSVFYLWRQARRIPAPVLPGVFETIFAFLATVQIVTSCRSRLFRNYENRSWWGYIRAWRFSEEYRLAFATGLTRSFVATRAEQMSARTGGLILAQLMYDISPFFTRHHPADRILNGPTQEVWIDRWTEHLTRQGVRFNPPIAAGERDGSPVRLVGLLPRSVDHPLAAPSTPAAESTGAAIGGFGYVRQPRGDGQADPGDGLRTSLGQFDYYVMAVSATGAQDVLANSDDVVAIEHEMANRTVPRGTDLPFQRSTDRWELADAGRPATIAGLFRLEFGWMNGIVYHLPRVVDLPQGHVLCLDSEWALTAVDQAPVWERVERSHRAAHEPIEARSVISVNVSDWFSPDGRRGRPARYHTLDAVRTEVWAQLQVHIPELRHVECPPPRRVVLDRAITDPNGGEVRPPTGPMADGLGPTPSERRPLDNAERLLINTERSWDDRPAAATAFSNLVLAGDYVRTSTDFASMEAANESARRAVRHILRLDGRDPADHPTVHQLGEPPELRCLVTLFRWTDAVLMSVGLPQPLNLLLGVFSWAAGIENLLRDRLQRLVEGRLVTPEPDRVDRPSSAESSTVEPQSPTGPPSTTEQSAAEKSPTGPPPPERSTPRRSIGS